jgi:hypothetical protein
MNITPPNPMSHEEAIKNRAAERFALGELTQGDRHRFEEHFFDCTECFENAHLATEFLQHTHKVLSPEQEKSAMASLLTDLWRPVPRVMAMLCLGLIGCGIQQQMTISRLQQPAQLLVAVLNEQTRSPGSERQISVPPGDRLAFGMMVPQREEFQSYRSLILSEPDKQVKFTVPLHLGADPVSATIVLPAEILHEGTYSILIQGRQKDGQWKTIEEDKKEAGGVFRLRAHGS